MSSASTAGPALDAARPAPGGARQRNRHRAGTLGLVALITLHELARRRGVLALALLLPLAFFLARLDTYWTALRLLSMGPGWSIGLLALALGALVAAVVPRDLEGALLLLAVMAVQVLVDPDKSWTLALPLWSARELASYILDTADAVGPLGPEAGDYLYHGLAHGTAYGLALGTTSWLLGVLRLRTIRLPEP